MVKFDMWRTKKQIARNAGTGRLLASPPMSSDVSSAGEAGGRGASEMESSDDDSYSTGESETDQDDVSRSARRIGLARSICPAKKLCLVNI